MLKHIITILVLVISAEVSFPQSFGFGCFGFVGGYGGYSYQKYQPGNLGEAVDRYNFQKGRSLISEFGEATGYRIGINIIRAKFENFFVSGKGYYQILSENKQYSSIENNFQINSELNFDLKSWGLGFDIGIPVTSALSWKIFDGILNFNSARLTSKPDLSDNTKEIQYNNDSPELSYSLGTGFIVSLAENFLSLEGTFGYTFLKIEQMVDKNGNQFFLGGDKSSYSEADFINGGGFSAVIQLNLGFPL